MGSVSPPTPSLRDNRLLALLDARTLAAIAPHFRPLTLELRTMLYVEGKAMRYAYFPVEGVMSMIAAVAGARAQIEVGTVGNEGMVGLPLFLGGKHALGDCFAQVSGVAWRIGGADFVAATQAHPAFARVLHRYTQALMVQISQSTACNRVHSVVERCARWLLMTQDRVQGAPGRGASRRHRAARAPRPQ